MPTHDLLDLHALRQRLGGKVYAGGTRWSGPGPGHSRFDQSLSVKLEGDRVLVHSFAGDPFKECAAYLGLSRPEPEALHAQRQRAQQRELQEIERRTQAWAWCDEVWRECVPIRETPADGYLESRGLTRCDHSDVRYHPSAPMDYDGERFTHAMVCAVRDRYGRPWGLHVTALTHTGQKSLAFGRNPRRMFGLCGGGAVQIGRPKFGEVAVCEGVETALSYQRMFGIAAWACLSTSGLRTFEPHADITLLHIAPDGDKAGREAGDVLKARVEGRVDVEMHDPGDDQDWNDYLRYRA